MARYYFDVLQLIYHSFYTVFKHCDLKILLFFCEILCLLRGSLSNSYVTKLHQGATEVLKDMINLIQFKLSPAHQKNILDG